MNMSSILFIVVLTAAMLRSTEAIDHIVGSKNGWISPQAGHSFYSDWASNITFKENDVLGEFFWYMLLKLNRISNLIEIFLNIAMTLKFFNISYRHNCSIPIAFI